MLACWSVAVVLMGGILTSYHQPFQSPDATVLTLVSSPGQGKWRTVHVLSGSCGCSQKVMLHLLERHPLGDTAEQILVVDDGEDYLPESSELLARLVDQGFRVTHIATKDIPKHVGLVGVPLLIVVSPGNRIAYMGGYGRAGDQDVEVLRQIQSGHNSEHLPVVGCAVGSRTRREADPFALKY